MTKYKAVMQQIAPDSVAMKKLYAIPDEHCKVKNYRLKKALVLALAVLLLLSVSGITAYAGNELYGWKLIEHEIARRGGTVTSRYYEETESGKRLKAMEYEYDSIYWHNTGRAVLEEDGFVVATEKATIKEEYAYLFNDETDEASESDSAADSFGITLTPDSAAP